MFNAGISRRRIARTLNAAYASGLLSEDTFLRRTERLLRGGVIDPARLVGDLSFPSRHAARLTDLWGPISRASARITQSRNPERLRSPTLLALDWSGAQSEMLIGRHHRCDVVLADLSVSRRHAQLRFRDGRWILQDLDSTNGTIVNGNRVGRCQLHPGDLVAIGSEHFTID